eukprot:4631759-Amphidinium_carterae.1
MTWCFTIASSTQENAVAIRIDVTRLVVCKPGITASGEGVLHLHNRYGQTMQAGSNASTGGKLGPSRLESQQRA